jgi:hypothetical protein
MWMRQALLLISVTGTVAFPDDACLVQKKMLVNPDEPNPVVLRDQKAVLVTANDQGEVRFVRYGKQYSYNMSATSVYTEDAAANAWTDTGLAPLEKRTRIFKSREQGRWAQATLHDDGTVSGLFEDQGHIMRISRSEHKYLKTPKIRTRSERVKEPKQHHYHNDDSAPFIYLDSYEDGMPHATYEGETSRYPLPSTQSWDGDLWYPGCFSGDDAMNDLKIGVIADTKAHSEVGSGLQASIEQAVAEASFVYERQMNIRLVIDDLKIYETQTGLSGKELDINADTCVDSDSENVMMKKIEDMKDFMKDRALQGVTHLFTGCGNGVGVIGVAWVGGLCDRVGYNTGVNQMTGDDTFLTFAHELGHNAGMSHPFAFGKEQSKGGIMDYGDGLLNGYYQFNKRYRRPEACPVLDDSMNHCEDRFGVQAPTFAPTPYPTIIPASTGIFGDIINTIINFLRALLDGTLAGNMNFGKDLRASATPPNFKALINNFLYKNVIAVAHMQLQSEDETDLAQQVLDALKVDSVQEQIEGLVDSVAKMNPTQQEIIGQILPHLDVSKAVASGTGAHETLDSVKEDIRKLLL